MISRGTNMLLVIAFVAASIIGLLYAFNQIDTPQTLEIAALTTLVLITAWYAKQTTIMAGEMRYARYDALRPIIDIVEQPVKGEERIKRGLDAKEGKFPSDLLCKLRSVGVGPAIEVYSFIEEAGGKPRRCDFGTIPMAIGGEEMGYTHAMRLFLEQRGEHRALVAYYKDVYDNPFESSREVSVDWGTGRVNIGALKICPLSKRSKPK